MYIQFPRAHAKPDAHLDVPRWAPGMPQMCILTADIGDLDVVAGHQSSVTASGSHRIPQSSERPIWASGTHCNTCTALWVVISSAAGHQIAIHGHRGAIAMGLRVAARPRVIARPRDHPLRVAAQPRAISGASGERLGASGHLGTANRGPVGCIGSSPETPRVAVLGIGGIGGSRDTRTRPGEVSRLSDSLAGRSGGDRAQCGPFRAATRQFLMTKHSGGTGGTFSGKVERP